MTARPRGVGRRAAVGAAVLAVSLGAAACSSSSGGSGGSGGTSVRINGAQGRIFGWVQYVAVEQGFLKKHGINGKIVPISSGPGDVSALVGGSVEATLNGVGLLVPYIQKGVGLKAITGVQKTGYDLVVSKSTDVSSAADAIKALKGQSVAIPSLGSGEQQQLDLMLTSVGDSPDDVNYLATGTLPAEAAAVKAGRVKAAMVDPSTAYTMEQGGYAKLAFDYFKDGADTAGMAAATKSTSIWVWVTSKWADSHPDAVKGLQDGFTETVNWMLAPANLAKLTSVLKKGGFLAGIASGDESHFVTAMLPQMSTDFSTAGIQSQIDFSRATGALKGDLTPDQVVYKPKQK